MDGGTEVAELGDLVMVGLVVIALRLATQDETVLI